MATQHPIDLRSDTVTRPTPAMLEAMMKADLGDDVLGDDPTVIALEHRFAEMLDKDAACFVPSGTMANQTAIRAQTEPGDEIISHVDSHICHYETGAPAALSGCMVRTLNGQRGLFTAEDVTWAVRTNDWHDPRSRLVIVENTHNRGGGSVWPIEPFEAVADTAHRHDLRVHLDGARLLNACVATGIAPSDYARHVDTVSMCFSKGLGAPVGSAVAGDSETISRVRRFKKMFGGAMRQAGILAAAGLYALEHHVDRLADDHTNARTFAVALAAMPGLRVDLDSIETNIIYFEVDDSLGSAMDVASRLDTRGVRMLALGPTMMRAVTHLDVSAEQIDKAIELIGDEIGAVPAA